MPDVLIRDLPEDVVAAIEANAQRLGISRNEYLRRLLAIEARPRATVTVADIKRSAGCSLPREDTELGYFPNIVVQPRSSKSQTSYPGHNPHP